MWIDLKLRPAYLVGFFILFILNVCPLKPAAAQSDPETAARQLFDNGNYADALPAFHGLVRLYPSDPDLNYYYGACLVETGQMNDTALDALMKAQGQRKSWWYLAQIYHSRSEWSKATDAYQAFTNVALPRDLKALQVDAMLDLCAQQINPFQSAEQETTAVSTPFQPDTTGSEPTAEPDTSFTNPEPVEVLPGELEVPMISAETESAPAIEPGGDPISFQVNAKITYLNTNQFKTNQAKQAFSEARKLETELNRKLQESKQLRDEYEQADDIRKNQLVESILKLEQETYQLSRQVTDADQKAGELEAVWWEKADLAEITALQNQNRLIRGQMDAAEQKKQEAIQNQARLVVIDAAQAAAMDSLEAESAPADAVVYKIQIGAYRSTPPDYVQRLYKKLAVLRRIDQYKDEKGVTIYTVGELKNYTDAQQMLKQIKLEGMNTAVIAAYKNNVRIPIEEARKITEQ